MAYLAKTKSDACVRVLQMPAGPIKCSCRPHGV